MARVSSLAGDKRLQLPEGNIFKYFQPETIVLPLGLGREEIQLRTAWEIEQERLSKKS